MKTRILIILIGIIVAGIIVQPNPVFGVWFYPTPEEFYNESDLIIVGRILSYDDSKPDMRYQIEIKEYVKKPENYEDSKIIDVFSCNPNPPPGNGIMGGCQTFEKDQDVFFGLQENQDGRFGISYGYVVQNQNCTGKQLVQTVNPTTGITILQNEKSYPLFTGIKTDVVYDFVNFDLRAKNFTSQFQLNRVFAVFGNNTFSETKQVFVPECVGHFIISASFIPTQAGIYNVSVTGVDNSSMSFGGLSITDENLPPLKQHITGVHAQDIWCKDGFILVLKHDDTPNLIFDNKPACVKPDTVPKLVQRDLIELSSFYQNRPLIERLHVGMAIIQYSDIPITYLSIDYDQYLAIQINDDELDKIPNAQEYYEQKIREIIPFNVPIIVYFGKF
jgi:hypothetical protein